MPIYGAYSGNTGTADTSYQPSAALFGRFDANAERRGRVIEQFEDFSNFRVVVNASGVPSTTELYWCNGWKAIGVATNGIFANIDAVNGGITFSTENADNDYLHINKCMCPFEISRTSQPLAFETRVKFASIADTKTDFVAGLGKRMTLTTAVPITTTAGTLAAEDYIVFHRNATDGDEINVVAGSTTSTVLIDGLCTLTADTYVKLGFLWDPSVSFDLKFFVNGVEFPTRYTVPASASAIIPMDARLGLLMGQTAAAASGGLTSASWIKCMQFVAS